MCPAPVVLWICVLQSCRASMAACRLRTLRRSLSPAADIEPHYPGTPRCPPRNQTRLLAERSVRGKRPQLLDGQTIAAMPPIVPRVGATGATTELWLFLEPRHCLGIGPARAAQVAIMLIPVLREAPPHVPISLMAPECAGASSHGLGGKNPAPRAVERELGQVGKSSRRPLPSPGRSRGVNVRLLRPIFENPTLPPVSFSTRRAPRSRAQQANSTGPGTLSVPAS